MPDNTVTLSIGGKKYTGWESISIRRSIDALCGSFEVSLVDQDDGKNWALATQLDVSVSIGPDLVISGVIDSVHPEVDKTSHKVIVRGRDKTCDLIDCSIVPSPIELINLDLFTIAQQICKPFGITVISEVDVGAKFSPKFAIQMGETGFDAIDRGCKLRGILPISNSKSNLVLTTSGANLSDEPLEWGQNVLAANSNFEYTNRFSRYIVQSQNPNAGMAIWHGSARGEFFDHAVKRYRPILLPAEGLASNAICKKRAQLEASVRAAKSNILNVTVQGWRQRTSAGTLWQSNYLVPVDIFPLFIDSTLLIVEVNYTQNNEDGTLCHMKLMRDDAFNAGTKFKTKKVGFQSVNANAVKPKKQFGFDSL